MIRAALLAALTLSVTAAAQEPTLPAIGDTEALDAGDRAPWPGMLVRDDDLFALQSGLMQCRFALTSGERLHVAILDSRIAIEVARTAAAVESAALHERLWRTEAERLAREAAAANERAGAWYASPILWGLVGAVVSAAICVALALTVGG